MKKRVFTDNYEDIIDLPHYVSQKRKQMAIQDRAAQFSPFAALTGHKEMILQAERSYEESMEQETEEFTDIYL